MLYLFITHVMYMGVNGWPVKDLFHFDWIGESGGKNLESLTTKTNIYIVCIFKQASRKLVPRM